VPPDVPVQNNFLAQKMPAEVFLLYIINHTESIQENNVCITEKLTKISTPNEKLANT
jgi:hypothetical protein